MWLVPRLHGVHAAPGDDPTKDEAIRDGIRAGDEEMRLSLFHQQLGAHRATPERVKKADDETADLVNHLRAKWKGTKYEKDFEDAFARQMKDPTYRDRAFASPPKIDRWTIPDLRNLGIDWHSPISILSAGLVVCVLVFALYMIGLGVEASHHMPNPIPRRGKTSGTYGTAGYAEPRWQIPDPMYIFTGVFFGKSSSPEISHSGPLANQQGAPICSTPERHALIIGQTRTGKGTRILVPTLLRYGAGSAFVIDPKGENTAITARARASHPLNQKVHIINPWNEKKAVFAGLGFTPATYNPLDLLDRKDDNCVANAEALALAICPLEKGSREAYWTNSAASLLTAVLLWITHREGLPAKDGVVEAKTLGRARDIVTRSRKDLKEKFLSDMARSNAFSGAIRHNAASFLDLAQETYSGVISNLITATKFLSDPQIQKNTEKSSFSMDELMSRVTTLYLIVPPSRAKTQRTWLRLLISAAMQTFKNRQSAITQRCLFLIDELPALGKLEDLPEDIATMAGYGVDFCLTVQGLDQLKEHYGASWATIVNNCAYKWFCNVGDLDSAQYLSQVVGQTTVQTTSTSSSFSMQQGQGSSSQGTNTGETGRYLIMPDEAMRLGRDVAILINPDDKPHYLRPIDYWDLPEAFYRQRDFWPHMYWDPPLQWDKNPYRIFQKMPAPATPLQTQGAR